MQALMNRLNRISDRLSDPNFLANKGLANEVGIHVFCYAPEHELIVRQRFEALQQNSGAGYRIIECDLYRIFLDICREKRILQPIPNMEARKGKAYLLNQLQRSITPEAFVEKMQYEPHCLGDVLLISGVGKVYPFMRSHKILDNIQHLFDDVPVLLLYPGTFNGQDLNLFGKFLDAHYYRAFNLL